MLLSEFFEELAYGELSDLSMAASLGEIKAEYQPKIVIKLNDFLTNLYTKYTLRLVDVDIPTIAEYPVYNLPYAHIRNSVRIVYAKPAYLGSDIDSFNSYIDTFRIIGNSLVFDKRPAVPYYSVKYQWRPTKMDINPATDGYLSQEIDLEEVVVPLVRVSVASGIFQSMNGEAHKATGMELFNQAQFMVNDLETQGILNKGALFQNNQFITNNFT